MQKTIIKSISFENFRGFQTISLDEMAPLTLISGKNNAGKSTILEGVFLLLDHVAADAFVKINSMRGLLPGADASTLWTATFYQMDTEKKMRILATVMDKRCELKYSKDSSFVPQDERLTTDIASQGIYTAKENYSLQFSYTRGGYKEEGHFSSGANGIVRNALTTLAQNRFETLPFAQFINSAVVQNDRTVIEWLGKAEIQGHKDRIIRVLQMIEPSIKDVLTISVNGQVQLYVRVGSQILPIKVAGDGLNKLLFVCLAVLENPNSVILIDEIETGFHYSMYSKLWKTLSALVKENGCQIIATTHSYECIVEAIKGIQEVEMEDWFCYYRIDRGEDCTNQAHRYSSKLLNAAIEAEMEVR